MSYYLGFRQGWVRVLGHGVGWYDARIYPHAYGGRTFGIWKVWMQ